MSFAGGVKKKLPGRKIVRRRMLGREKGAKHVQKSKRRIQRITSKKGRKSKDSNKENNKRQIRRKKSGLNKEWEQ